ncbi:receptor-type adenylate cyclase, putative, partial [Trypanosoma cruzi]
MRKKSIEGINSAAQFFLSCARKIFIKFYTPLLGQAVSLRITSFFPFVPYLLSFFSSTGSHKLHSKTVSRQQAWRWGD